MKIKEFLVELSLHPEIITTLTNKGYRRLAAGEDQMAFLEPGTGYILKVFGTNSSSAPGKITFPQKTFKAFADYCMANPNNPFLPHFDGWETFEFEEQTYLQIRMERLFPFGEGALNWGPGLERLALRAKQYNSPEDREKFKEWIINDYDVDYFETMLIELGEEFDLLWDTIFELSKIAQAGGFNTDLHEGNFMLGSDGHIVISDPFFSGWDKRGL